MPFHTKYGARQKLSAGRRLSVKHPRKVKGQRFLSERAPFGSVRAAQGSQFKSAGGVSGYFCKSTSNSFSSCAESSAEPAYTF